MTFPFQPPSEEELAEARAAQERMQLAMDDFRHATQRIFVELPQEHLETLKAMLHHVAHTDPSLAAYWEGAASAHLLARFKVCMTCGVNHEDEFQHNNEAPRSSESSEPIVAEVANIGGGISPAVEPEPIKTFTDENFALMKRYHLDDVRDEETHELLRFACTGIEGMRGPCGVTYPSIEDRMLREPEHCSGCFSKMGQG